MQALIPQFTSRTMAATVALHTVVAGQRVVAHQVEHAQFVGQSPCLAFVDPHQRRMQDELLVHGQVQGHIQTFDKRVPTIRITAEVRLRHPGHNMVDAPFTGIHGSNADEEQVTPGNKRIRTMPLGLLLIHLHGGVGQRVPPQRTDERNIHTVPVHIGP